MAFQHETLNLTLFLKRRTNLNHIEILYFAYQIVKHPKAHSVGEALISYWWEERKMK